VRPPVVLSTKNKIDGEKRMNRNFLRFDICKVAVLFILLALATASIAQTSLGTIAGVVTDPQGAVIQNATVTAVSNATGEKHSTTTNSLGAYRIESVGSGAYTITVKAAKFSDLKIAGAVVTASVTTTVNATLKVGVAETVVTVETVGEQLHTEDGAITHNISSVEITSIPIGNLNPISLVLTEPGVIQPSGRESFTNGVGFSVNGTRPRANNFLIEGFDNNDAAIQGQALQVDNLEATKEVSILTNSYNAEFGHGGGSVTNLIYKSGSNAWHGSIFDLLQNSTLDANNASNKINGSPKPKSRENTYGFTIGGPVKHDKIFVFGSIQWDKQRQGTSGSTLTVPTAAGFATLQSIAAGNPRVTNLLSALGSLRASPTGQGLTNIALSTGPNVEVARVQRLGIAEPSNDTQYVAKGDWQLSSNDTITIRYTYDKGDLSPDFFNFPNLLPCCDTQQGGAAHNGGLSYTHSFSPKVINEFRASYGRIGFTFGPTAATAANPVANGPTVSIAGLTGYGMPSNIPQGRFHNTYQYQDSVSWLVGNHSFKFGADMARILVRDAIPFNSRGTLGYAAGNGTGLANFVDDFGGSGGSANLTFGSPIIRPRYFFQNYFAQDTWKLRPNLTLTLGIRYENAGTPENSMPFPTVDGHTGVFDTNFFTTPHPQQDDNNNFAPRVSFAYTPRFLNGLFGRDKTVIRAGFGEYFDNVFTNIVDNSAASSPNAVSKSIISTAPGVSRGTANLSGAFSALTPTPTVNAAVTSIINNIISPETYQWNLDIERELGANFVLTTSYVGTRGVHLLVNDQFNPIVNAATGARLNPAFGSWTVRDNGGDSIYHALDVKLDRRFSHGLLLRGSYTFSKLIDTGSEVFTTTGNSSFPENLSNRALDRGLSAFDRRHRFVVTYVYDIPKFRNDSNFGAKFLGHVVNGWQIAGTAAYQTGAPFTVSDGVDQNGDGTASDRPTLANINAPVTNWAFVNPAGGFCDGPTQLAGKGCRPFLNGTWDQHGSPTPANWTGTLITADNIHWIVPAAGTTLGTFGRNNLTVPGRQDWTFGLQRSIALHSERHQLVVRMEMLNPFNHPNTGNPLSTNLSGVSFFNVPGSSVCNNLTTCSVVTPGVAAPAVNFFNTASTVTGERDIRFWFKYQF
jgi:hypothetical protein